MLKKFQIKSQDEIYIEKNDTFNAFFYKVWKFIKALHIEDNSVVNVK